MATAERIPGAGPVCPECTADAGAEVRIDKVGRAPDAMLLGLHRKKEHGVEGTGRRTKRPPQSSRRGRSSAGAGEGATPLAVVRDMRDGAGKTKGAPTREQLTDSLGRGYGYGMTYLASAIVDGDPRFATEADKDRAIEALAPTAQEATMTVAPVARALAGTSLNRKYGRGVVDNMDVLDCFFAISEQMRRFNTYRRERAQYEQGVASGTVRPFTRPPGSAGDQAAEPEGRVMTPADIGNAPEWIGGDAIQSVDAFDLNLGGDQ